MSTSECSFPGVKQSVSESRAWLGHELELAGVSPAVIADAALVLSELVTNSVVHSRSAGPLGSILVRLRLGVTKVRLEVSDAGGAGEPRARRNGQPEPLAQSGHGLALVEHCTTRWWTRGDSNGRTVGAEIAREPAGLEPLR
jgi:anti-sigma regulatory factor (Ser/Thr protein kinase)